VLVQALRTAHFAAGARMIAGAGKVKGDLQRLETIVLEALPLDAERIREWKTHLAFWGAAADNERLRRENARRFREWGELLEQHLAPIVPHRDACRREAVLLMALIDGLALRMVLHAEGGDQMHVSSPTRRGRAREGRLRSSSSHDRQVMNTPASEIVDTVRFHLRAV